MKERFKRIAFISTLFSCLFLTSCSINSDTPLWKVILLIIGIIAGMIIINSILEFLAIKLAVIYWPAVLAYAIILFFKAKNLLAGDVDGGFNLIVRHVILLYFFIPNLEDSIHIYDKVTYQYDITFDEWRETERKTIKEETPGFILKLVLIAFLIVLFYFAPTWFFKNPAVAYKIQIYLPLVIVGIPSLILTILAIKTRIKNR